LTVGGIELSAHQPDVKSRERLYPEEIEDNIPGGRIKQAIQIRLLSVPVGHVGNRLSPRAEPSESFRIEGTDGFCEVAVDIGVLEINCVRSVIREHPWENRVLRQVIVRSTRIFVELDQKIEIGHFAIFPAANDSFDSRG
jgi:hypothetical protein